MTQLMLLKETPIEMLIRENKELRLSLEKIRKSLYAKLGAVEKIAHYGKHEVDTLKEALCRTTQNDYADLPLFSQKIINL